MGNILGMTASVSSYFGSTRLDANKHQVTMILKFSEELVDWEDWLKSANIYLGQLSQYEPYRTRLPKEGDISKYARNREFYYMLMEAIQHGTAKSMVDNIKNECGYTAWNTLIERYGSDSCTRQVMMHYRNMLDALTLDQDTSATSYINTFKRCHQKLEKQGEGYTSKTKQEMFLKKIVDDNYHMIRENLQADSNLSLEECIQRIRAKEQNLDLERSMSKKSRRFKPGKSVKGISDKKRHGNKKEKRGQISLLPKKIFD